MGLASTADCSFSIEIWPIILAEVRYMDKNPGDDDGIAQYAQKKKQQLAKMAVTE